MGEPKVVQPAGCFHHIIHKVVRAIAKLMHPNVAPFDTPNLMLDFDPFARNVLIALLRANS